MKVKNKLLSIGVISIVSIFISTILINTSCSSSHKTINPFYSSFETNDKPALQNEQKISPINIESLTTQVTTGPSHGYGTKVDYGYSGFKSFEYNAKYINDNTDTTFSNYIYKDLNIVIGKNTEFSYKIFPNFADNSDDDLKHNLNYLSTFVSVDLLYNNKSASLDNLKSLSASGIKDINGNGLTPREQGSAKSLFSYQWNLVKVDLSQLKGKHIHQIIINFDMHSPDRTKSIYGDRLNGDPATIRLLTVLSMIFLFKIKPSLTKIL